MCVSYRGLLALYAGAVEPQSRDAVCAPLDVEDTFIVPLSRLGLGQVLGQQGDRPHNSSRDIDLGGGQDLRTLLEMRKKRIKGVRYGKERHLYSLQWDADLAGQNVQNMLWDKEN